MERPGAAVLSSRGLVLVGGPDRVRAVSEADEMRRVLDGFARARGEREEKHEGGEATEPDHGAHPSRRGAHGSGSGYRNGRVERCLVEWQVDQAQASQP